ncbi:keratin, type I cytoskeletal 13-like [Kryptolebias marmoratus]|uniref:Keratin 98 n=1 Tax=Kryptolebias marmoratus TaxID=37003 RepID=A0A3Q3BCQ0_KRYMA|nr:keratin, type I cytoskeletal 13-like [Kryptolebias marmoratus]
MSFSSRSYSQNVSQKTVSVYGGAGGRGTRASTSVCFLPAQGRTDNYNLSYKSFGGSLGLGNTEGLDLHVDETEKAAMQNLNNRLASYLEKVHKLEKENQLLEKQIREWYESKTVTTHDYSHYYVIIQELQDKIRAALVSNSKVVLDIDNAKLAADDFRMKYENEMSMRMAVEGDIAGLKRMLDEMNLIKMDLESQYESYKEELIMMKKNHEEELLAMRNQIGGQVNVSVDAPSPVDLNQVMTEIREHYESLIAKNRKDLEAWYQNKIATVEVEVKESSDSLMTQRTEVKDLKSVLQRLQIELQSELSMKSSLEGTLAETQVRYSDKLSGFQFEVTSKEDQSLQLKADRTKLNEEFGTLLDLKTRLESEIEQYRRLLDGEDDSSKQVITKVITVQETVIDGKVVQSSKSVGVNQIQ